MRTYIKCKNKSLFYYYYFYIDILQEEIYLADRIFVKNNLNVKFIKDYKAPSLDLYGHIVKVKKKDEKVLLKCLEELNNKMILLGYNDYEKIYDFLLKDFKKVKEE